MSSAPAPRARKGDFVDNRIGAGVPSNENLKSVNVSAPASNAGFSDSGAPAIKVHHAPGSKSSDNTLGWKYTWTKLEWWATDSNMPDVCPDTYFSCQHSNPQSTRSCSNSSSRVPF